jgi:UDP-glucose 4-epimerase
MKILVTGSAGRVGRAIYIELMKKYKVIGLDRSPCSTADFVGDIRDHKLMKKILRDVDVIVHTAALHAPHIGYYSEKDFNEINVQAVKELAELSIENSIKQFIYTSTTALYGYASTPTNITGWVNENTIPQPKTIYHKTKLEAENKLESYTKQFDFHVTCLEMSRCFPEPADLMTLYRLTRGIDARDVATAHLLAIEKKLKGFNRYIISGKTPFNRSQCSDLFSNADILFREFAPMMAKEFDKRGWKLPSSIDRVYDSSLAQSELGWNPKFGYDEVLKMLDAGFSEVYQL